MTLVNSTVRSVLGTFSIDPTTIGPFLHTHIRNKISMLLVKTTLPNEVREVYARISISVSYILCAINIFETTRYRSAASELPNLMNLVKADIKHLSEVIEVANCFGDIKSADGNYEL